jgi:hypothetical protein
MAMLIPIAEFSIIHLVFIVVNQPFINMVGGLRLIPKVNTIFILFYGGLIHIDVELIDKLAEQ